MTALFAVLLAVTGTPEKGERAVEAVTLDGGSVPIVAPNFTGGFAPLLAPERAPDAGFVTEAGIVPVAFVPDPTLSVYKINLGVEAAVTAASLGLFVFVDFLIKPTLEGDISCRRPVGSGRCNPDDLIGWDRYSVGRSSKAWSDFGDVALFGSLLVPVLYLGLESLVLPTVSPWGDFAGDLLVITESMALAGAFQMVMKFAFRRPRPARYTDLEEPATSFDAELSFPSGHTMLVGAATTALTTTVFLRHPRSPMRWVVLGAGALLTGLTAFSRVESGQHFPTDVIVGALLGGFAGFIVPYTHRKELPVTPIGGINPLNGSASFGVSGKF